MTSRVKPIRRSTVEKTQGKMMKSFNKILFVFLIAVMLLSACNGGNTEPTPTLTPTSWLPDPVINVESVPDVEHAAKAYLDLWKAEDYAGMYNKLSQLTRDAISPEDFEKSHRDTAIKLFNRVAEFFRPDIL